MSLKLLTVTVLGFVAIVMLGYGGLIIFLFWPITQIGVENAGLFSDSFGIITSLVSGLALAGIILTILLQRDELKLQRKELSLTREELRLTREEMRNQHVTIKHQNFQSTFFQMLRLHNDIVNSIDLRTVSGKIVKLITGRDCFVNFSNKIKECYSIVKKSDPGASEADILEGAYAKFWNARQQEVGHYFRYLYTIFKFVKTSEIEDKKFYSNIVRAQLSDQELVVLFYNCLY